MAVGPLPCHAGASTPENGKLFLHEPQTEHIVSYLLSPLVGYPLRRHLQSGCQNLFDKSLNLY
jgi:hypothetical protein